MAAITSSKWDWIMTFDEIVLRQLPGYRINRKIGVVEKKQKM